MIVAISGPPGSGKTTVAERFASSQGFELISAGAAFRERAADFGMSLERFGRYALEHQEVDRELDEDVIARVLERTASGASVVVDGRVQPWLLAERGVKCVRVLIDAPLPVRAERVAGRERTTVKQAAKEIRDRETSERSRYAKIYGIRLRDRSVFDLVIDSSDKTPDEIVSAIAERVREWATS